LHIDFTFTRRRGHTGGWLAALLPAAGLVFVLAQGPSPALASSSPPVTSGPNLIVNGGAELGDASGSGYDTVTIPGWQISGEPTIVRYGQHADGYTGTAGDLRGENNAGQFPTSSTPGPGDRGAQLFVGGAVGDDTLTQTVSLGGAATAISGGGVKFTLSGWLGGNGSNASAASLSVTFLSASGSRLSTRTSLGPVTATDRLMRTELLPRSATGTVSPGARSALITLTLTDATRPNVLLADSYNNAYADTLALHISAPVAAPPAPTPPASTVGRLQHVFMVYMENEGDGDIVGSPQAPYINGLIDHYGFATDYHGLQHPSDPNYIAFFGGATYGIDTDCALACTVNERNLADQIEAAHESWRFYEQTMPSPCYHADAGPKGSGGSYYAPDELPWAYFSDLADNIARCDAHVFGLGQMSTDLASTATTPNYVWFEADDCNDMEQCGIPAGDTWLSDTVPEIINSPAFRTQRSAIFITWDEDYNNKSFNQDNQDNVVPMIVIGSPKSGLRSGPVRSANYYTHYGLLRTVQAALGLPADLALNDQYAAPLNAFWPAVPALSRLRVRRRGRRITLHYRDSAASRTTIVVWRGRRRLGSFTHRDRSGALSDPRALPDPRHPGQRGRRQGHERLGEVPDPPALAARVAGPVGRFWTLCVLFIPSPTRDLALAGQEPPGLAALGRGRAAGDPDHPDLAAADLDHIAGAAVAVAVAVADEVPARLAGLDRRAQMQPAPGARVARANADTLQRIGTIAGQDRGHAAAAVLHGQAVGPQAARASGAPSRHPQ
jgi:hypothetical protein